MHFFLFWNKFIILIVFFFMKIGIDIATDLLSLWFT